MHMGILAAHIRTMYTQYSQRSEDGAGSPGPGIVVYPVSVRSSARAASALN